MCHDQLDWQPIKNVNFVTGVNGSGKSSILQGLVLGLLGESKNTKRYNRLQDFIQKGHSRAMVEVTLKNEGEDAYRSELYGASITFQRIIDDNGQTNVILKDHQQNVVKKAKDAREEGKRILQNFSIETDNPVAILQQEEAKDLLKVESPENLYTFFHKASLLKQCHDQYSVARRDLEKTREIVETKKLQLGNMKKQLTEKYEKVKVLNMFKERDLEEEYLLRELVWALIKESRAEQDDITDNIHEKEGALENPRKKLEQLHKFLVELINQRTQLVDEAEQERGQFAREEKEIHELKDETARLTLHHKKVRAEIKGYESMKETLEGEIQILEEHIKQFTSSQVSDKMTKERQMKLNRLEVKRTDINECIEKMGDERDAIESEQDENLEELKKSEYERKDCQKRKEHLESELAEIVQLEDQKLAVFDRLAPRVAEEISSAVRKKLFKVCPLGPVGSYIKLSAEAATNTDLARLLETELGMNQMKAYVCNDEHDRKVLQEIFSRVYEHQKKPVIFTSKFLSKKHNVDRVESHDTVLDYLKIIGSEEEATVIFNHLVDQKGIESVVVCETQDEAKQICTFEQTTPENMKYAITHDFYRFFPPTTSTSYRSYFMEPLTSQMLVSTVGNMREEKKTELGRTELIMQNIIDTHMKLMQTKTDLKRRCDEIISGMAVLRNKLTEIYSEKSQLKAVDDFDISVEIVTQDLNDKRDKFEELSELHIGKLVERDNVDNIIKKKMVVLKKKYQYVVKLREALSPLEREISRTEDQISLRKREISKQEKLLKRLKTEVNQLKRDCMEQRRKEEEFLKKAKEKSWTEVAPSGTVLQLNAKIRQIRETKRANPLYADKENLLDEFKELKDDFELQRRKVAKIEEHMAMMVGMNTARITNYMFIRKTISSIVERKFQLLTENFSSDLGTQMHININHRSRELNLVFRNTDGDLLDTEVGSLSGGEKSFAQMCLIAAMWEIMRPPFRALDEWDVFLDALNRKTISNKLLQIGLSKMEYQFLFISPQGASDIMCDPSDKNKVAIFNVIKN